MIGFKTSNLAHLQHGYFSIKRLARKTTLLLEDGKRCSTQCFACVYLIQVKLMEKHLHKGSLRLLQFNQEHSKYTQQRVESLEERSENHNHDLPELVDLITRGLMGAVIDQTKLKAELSKTLHGLVRDVMAASHEPGATSTQGTQLNNKMLRKWSTLKGSKVQLNS
jgi:hypothetical protein